jgi:MGT family glycosyltransferase
MSKYIFFGLPLISVHKALLSVMSELSSRGNTVIYYNTADFSSNSSITFISKAYPSYCTGYDTSRIGNNTSFFSFSEMLLDTTISLFDFLRNEVSFEKPDLIAHSHLALWGKLIAIDSKLPAISIYTTFSLSQSLMIPFFRRQQEKEKKYKDTGIEVVMRLQKKYQSFYKTVGFSFKPDIWDSYINKEECNIFLILKEFSYENDPADGGSTFVGYPVNKPNNCKNRKFIYVSMGTIFNDDAGLFKLIIDALGDLNIPSIVSIGSKIDKSDIGTAAPNVTVVDFVDQESVLGNAMIFITRGGMASIHEAVASVTPIVVIPEIPEQQLTAEKVDKLGIGIQISVMQLTKIKLLNSLKHMLSNLDFYTNNLNALIAKQPLLPPSELASNVIEEYYLSCNNHGSQQHTKQIIY